VFKGSGHDRLVSRRWLEAGPWVVHRGADDLSVLQLHDFDADKDTAAAQVQASQERLGPSETGGVVMRKETRRYTFNLQYSPRARRATIVVAKREVTPREMLEATLLRGSNAAGPDSPLEHVAFLYIDEAQAQRDLHELWLHGLECWTYIRGVETRIDEAYVPPPRPRPW